jgi:flagellar basal body-associated protein FliL
MAYIPPPLLEEPLPYAPNRKGKGEGPHIGQILLIAVVVGVVLFFVAVFIAIVVGGGGQA